jgi:tRNA modification GTPase
MQRAENDDHDPAIAAAMLTPAGRGAVATVRIRGDLAAVADSLTALFRAADGRPLVAHSIGRVVFGRWGDPLPEEVVVCRIDERTVDVHCHGGVAAPRRVLRDLQCAGATVVTPLDMQQLTDGRFQAEMLTALSRTRTLRTAEIVLEQAAGLLESALRDLLAAVRNESGGVVAEVDGLLRFAAFGRHLTEPWQVVLTGRPNVGKSSLMNALVGFSRSIVFDRPGTTRDVVTAEAAFDGWPVELIDTAGIRESSESLEASGVDRARSALQSADCRVLLLDVGEPLTADDQAQLHGVSNPIVVAHKCDLSHAWEPGDAAGRYGVEFLCVSSKTGEGVEDLQKEIVHRLVPEVPAPGTPVPLSPRQIASLRNAREAASRHDLATASLAIAEFLN